MRSIDGVRALSFVADNSLDVSQEGVAIYHRRLRIIENPLLADHTLRVDQEKCSKRAHDLLVQDAVSPDDFPFDEVAQQRVGQL